MKNDKLPQQIKFNTSDLTMYWTEIKDVATVKLGVSPTKSVASIEDHSTSVTKTGSYLDVLINNSTSYIELMIQRPDRKDADDDLHIFLDHRQKITSSKIDGERLLLPLGTRIFVSGRPSEGELVIEVSNVL